MEVRTDDEVDAVLAEPSRSGTDVVFGTKQRLVVPFEQREGGVTPAGVELDRPWREARYDFVLQPAP